MRINRDWRINLDQDAFMREYGHTFARVLRRPGMAEAFDETFREAAELVEPAVAWDCFPVREMRHEQVILADGRRIGNGPVTTVMGGAEQLAIGVCTIGPKIPERSHEYRDRGEAVRGMLLDQLGSLAVGQLSQLFYRQLEMAAASLCALRIEAAAVPFVSCARKYARMGAFPGGAADNRLYFRQRVTLETALSEPDEMLLFDPQTSGGLLLCVPAARADAFRERAAALNQPVWEIGVVEEGEGIHVV